MRICSVVALVAAATFAACGGSSPSTPADRPVAAARRYGSVHLAACEAADAAGAGDKVGANESFEDVHGALHDLAAAAEAKDRPMAARLLEAKQAVEAGTDVDAYAALLRAVEDAIDATGDEVGKCPE